METTTDGYSIQDESIYVRPDGGRMPRWAITDGEGSRATRRRYQTRTEARDALRLARALGRMLARAGV